VCGVHRLNDTLSELDSLGESIALNHPNQPATKYFTLAQQPTKICFFVTKTTHFVKSHRATIIVIEKLEFYVLRSTLLKY